MVVTSSETLKYTFAETFINGHTSYVIHEHSSSTSESRYFELQQVINRPNFLRVTLFANLTMQTLSNRGTDLCCLLGSLKNFIHLTNSSINILATNPSTHIGIRASPKIENEIIENEEED
jgi:hypothetical protein